MWSWAVMDKKWEWPLTLSFPLPLLPSSSISPLYSTLLSPIYSSCPSGFIGFYFSFLPFLFFQFSFLYSFCAVCLSELWNYNYTIMISSAWHYHDILSQTSAGIHLVGGERLQSNLDVWHGSYQCLLPSSFCFLCLHVLPKPKLDIDYFIVGMTDLWSPHRTCVSIFLAH